MHIILERENYETDFKEILELAKEAGGCHVLGKRPEHHGPGGPSLCECGPGYEGPRGAGPGPPF